MEYKDYYKVMGVAPDSTADDNKPAYRQLARKYQTDLSKVNDAEERIQ